MHVGIQLWDRYLSMLICINVGVFLCMFASAYRVNNPVFCRIRRHCACRYMCVCTHCTYQRPARCMLVCILDVPYCFLPSWLLNVGMHACIYVIHSCITYKWDQNASSLQLLQAHSLWMSRFSNTYKHTVVHLPPNNSVRVAFSCICSYQYIIRLLVLITHTPTFRRSGLVPH